MPEQKSTFSQFLTPSGALLALIAFFLPWVRLSCAGQVHTVNGFQLAKSDAWYWGVFACALVVFLAYIFFKKRGEFGKLKKITLTLAVAGVGVLLYKYFDFKSSMDSIQNFAGGNTTGWPTTTDAGTQDFEMALQFGAYTCLAGFILAFLGGLFLPKDEGPQIGFNTTTSPGSRRTTTPSTRPMVANRHSGAESCGFCVNGLPPGLVNCPECGAQRPTVRQT